jgi:hypothetical protein
MGIEPDGMIFEGANRNAAGVSTMLEIARLWQEQNLDPRRSVWFIAWGGGALEESGVNEFLASENSYRHLPANATRTRLAPRVLVQLDYAGAGGDTLLIHPQSNSRLAELFEESAVELGIEVDKDPGQQMPPLERWNAPQSAWLSFAWNESSESPADDNMERIEPEKLQSIGRIVSHVLTQIVRQTSY